MTTSLEGWPTKTKKAPFPKVRMAPLDTNLVFLHISKVCPIWNYTWKHYFHFTFVCFHGTTILQKFRKKNLWAISRKNRWAVRPSPNWYKNALFWDQQYFFKTLSISTFCLFIKSHKFAWFLQTPKNGSWNNICELLNLNSQKMSHFRPDRKLQVFTCINFVS